MYTEKQLHILLTPVSLLGLPALTESRLYGHRIRNVATLLTYHKRELAKMYAIGSGGLKSITKAVEGLGFKVGELESYGQYIHGSTDLIKTLRNLNLITPSTETSQSPVEQWFRAILPEKLRDGRLTPEFLQRVLADPTVQKKVSNVVTTAAERGLGLHKK